MRISFGKDVIHERGGTTVVTYLVTIKGDLEGEETRDECQRTGVPKAWIKRRKWGSEKSTGRKLLCSATETVEGAFTCPCRLTVGRREREAEIFTDHGVGDAWPPSRSRSRSDC